ncbi:MAG TPA: multicopper oxidase domain-containing protein [Gammaproteobacteria bacterium]|nr:multicopper oxidase domain-containing protein [Gammaproteobacteria bacterium]
MLDKSDKSSVKLRPLVSAVGATFAVTLSSVPLVNAQDNPFSLNELSNGYRVAQEDTGQKPPEGKCGEGKCSAGMDMSATKSSEPMSSEGVCANMVMDMQGMIMNENKDQLPQDCKAISEEVKITVHAGRKFARKFNGTAFAFDQQEWDVKPCAKITVTFVNEDQTRHQFMVHGLPAYIYPAGMFHMEIMGQGEKTATFIVPSTKKTYLVHCDIAQHMEKGMKAQLKVAGGDGDLPSIPGLTGPRYPQEYPEAYPKGAPSPYSASDPTLFRGMKKDKGG